MQLVSRFINNDGTQRRKFALKGSAEQDKTHAENARSSRESINSRANQTAEIAAQESALRIAQTAARDAAAHSRRKVDRKTICVLMEDGVEAKHERTFQARAQRIEGMRQTPTEYAPPDKHASREFRIRQTPH